MYDEQGKRVWRSYNESDNAQERHDKFNDSTPHVYLSSGPSGRGGYWGREENGSYVWYAYVRPGVFEKDPSTTYNLRNRSSSTLKKESSRSGTPQALERGSRNRYSRIQRLNGEGFWRLNEQGKLVWFNKSLATASSKPAVETRASGAPTTAQPGKSYWGKDANGKFGLLSVHPTGGLHYIHSTDCPTCVGNYPIEDWGTSHARQACLVRRIIRCHPIKHGQTSHSTAVTAFSSIEPRIQH